MLNSIHKINRWGTTSNPAGNSNWAVKTTYPALAWLCYQLAINVQCACLRKFWTGFVANEQCDVVFNISLHILIGRNKWRAADRRHRLLLHAKLFVYYYGAASMCDLCETWFLMKWKCRNTVKMTCSARSFPRLSCTPTSTALSAPRPLQASSGTDIEAVFDNVVEYLEKGEVHLGACSERAFLLLAESDY